VLFQPNARIIHVGSTSKENPLVVEWHKGKGLVRYFLKRADSPQRKLLALVLAPLILGVAVARPLLRQLVRGRMGRPVERLAPLTKPPLTKPAV
jgi:N-acetylglucosaminyl-diphospho-decaprenol L-rhamnosyltransferase